MNAVKRCLALIAATLVVGACGGDPTIDDAGTNLSIRATPGAVWMRNNTSATVTVEAVDKLGGPAEGSWSIGTITGPFTVVLDSAYQNTSVGTLGLKSRYVITPTDEGDGSVQFTGTGGDVTVQLRAAPDSSALEAVFDSPTQVGDTVTVPLNAAVTLHLVPGLRFTSATTVQMVTGISARDTSLWRPINYSIAADSATMTFTPGPNSTGQARITAIANAATPSLVVNARTKAIIKTDHFDTTASTRLPLLPAAAALGDTISVTLPADYRFTPGTTINYVTVQSNGAVVTTNGQAAPFKVSTSADSGTITYLAGPGVHGSPRFTGIVVRENTVFNFAARSADSTSIPAIPFVNTTFSGNNIAVNTPVTVTLPAGYKYRPTSRTSGGTSAFTNEMLSVSADSTQMQVMPSPGLSAPVTLTNLQNTLVPPLGLALPTDDTLKVAAATTVADAGQDNAFQGPIPIIVANLAVGEAAVLYDRGTYDNGDDFGFGTNEQDYELHIGNAGNYTVQIRWNNGTDVDEYLGSDDLSVFYGSNNGNQGATLANPEVITADLPAGTFYLFTGAYGAAPGAIRITIRRNS